VSESIVDSVLFTGDIFRLQHFGGISRYILELHRQFVQLGLNSVIAATGSRSRMLGPEAGVRQHQLKTPPNRVGRLISSKLGACHDRQLASKLSRSSVIHRSYYGPSMRSLAPTVTTVHDLIPRLFPHSGTDGRSHFIARNAHDSQRIIVPSQNTKHDLVNLLSVRDEKIDVIYSGIEPIQLRERIDFLVDIPDDFILFVGHRSGYKNWSGLIKAMAVKPLRNSLPIVCFGGSPRTASEETEIRDAGLNSQSVTFLEGSDTILDELYRRATMLVYPSLYEGFGFPPLEAMARGCPVVASQAASIPEVVGAAGILVDGQDPESIANGIIQALDPVRRSQLIAAGATRVSLFTWQKAAEQTIESYQKALQ
jgi:glycosyltransferase involved in cell wall biosynthesis